MTLDLPPTLDMRQPCPACHCRRGRIEVRNGQDCVLCTDCGQWVYNAPRVETGRAPRTVSSVHGALRPKLRARVLERDSHRCVSCGSRDNLHVGHLLSVNDGLAQGLTELDLNHEENLVTLCAECNLGQGDRTISLRLAVGILRAKIAEGARLDEVQLYPKRKP